MPRTKPFPPLSRAVKRRRWLNPEGSGHIMWSVGLPKIGQPNAKGVRYIQYPDTEFVLADCNRKISLDFEHWDKTDAAVLKKVDALLADVLAFRTALHSAYAAVAELKSKYPDWKE